MLWLHDTGPLEVKSGAQAIQGTKAPSRAGEGVCLTARLHVVDYCMRTLAAFQDTWGSNRDQLAECIYR